MKINIDTRTTAIRILEEINKSNRNKGKKIEYTKPTSSFLSSSSHKDFLNFKKDSVGPGKYKVSGFADEIIKKWRMINRDQG